METLRTLLTMEIPGAKRPSEVLSVDPLRTPVSGNPAPKTRSRTEQESEQQQQPQQERPTLVNLLIEALRHPDVAAAQASVIEGVVVKGVADVLSRVVKIEERVEGLSGAVGKAQEGIAKGEANTARLDGRIKGVESQVTKLKTEVTHQKAEVSEMVARVERDMEAVDQSLVKGLAACTVEQERMQRQLTDLSARMAELGGPGEESAAVAALRAEVVAMKELVAALQKPAGGHMGGAAWGRSHGGPSSPPPAAATVQAALKAEADAAQYQVKLQGLEGVDVGKSGPALCHEAGEVLSRMAGITIAVQKAFWLKGTQQGHVPQLVVATLTKPMATAVRQLRLGAGKRVMGWYGPVEKAVRDVLFKEREAMLSRDKQAQVRVEGHRLMVGGVEQPLSQAAIAAGMGIITKPKPAGQPHRERQHSRRA
jgi:hypothetical protein